MQQTFETAATIRPVTSDDVVAVGEIAEAAGLFPAELLPAMIADHLQGAIEQVWLLIEQAGAVTGFAFAEPERLTDRTWNLRAIGVDPPSHRQGLATALLDVVETTLRQRFVRPVVIETTDGEDQRAARAFYPARGYREEARIQDFWETGVAKLVFGKRF